jgi:O-methyltransferase
MTLFGTHIESLVSNDRLCNIIKYSQLVRPLGGYMAEFGVYTGGSLEVLAKFNRDNEIFGIDSFVGLPKQSEYDFHRQGDFADGVNVNTIAGYFKMAYPNVRIVQGFSPDVFSYFDNNVRFSFVHIDVDLYESVLHALDFFIPRMLTGGIIISDDYKVRSTPGCEKAIIDFFEQHKPEVSYSGELKYWEGDDAKSHNQYIIVK